MMIADGGDEPEDEDGQFKNNLTPGKFAKHLIECVKYEFYREPYMYFIPGGSMIKKAYETAMEKWSEHGHSTFAMIQFVIRKFQRDASGIRIARIFSVGDSSIVLFHVVPLKDKEGFELKQYF